MILSFHVLGGGLALVFGYVALLAAKGGTLHRKSGMLFVVAMVAMSASAVLMAAVKASPINVIAGSLTFYFVMTSLLTVRRRLEASRWIDGAAMLFALVVTVLAFKTGSEILGTGPEAIPMFIFGAVGVVAAIGDGRMIRAGGIQGRRRIVRHLWRMCFAMWVAAASFFWGPPDRVPESIRIPALQAVAVLTPIAVMVYWRWKLRARNSLRGVVSAELVETT